MRGRRAVNFVFGLASDFINRSFICKLGDELVCLDIDIWFTWGSFRRFDISGEELLCCFSFLLLQLLWVVFLLVGLKQLVGVSARRNYHSCICWTSKDTFIIHDILRVIFFNLSFAIGILVLILMGDNSGMSSKAPLVLGLRKHSLNLFILI